QHFFAGLPLAAKTAPNSLSLSLPLSILGQKAARPHTNKGACQSRMPAEQLHSRTHHSRTSVGNQRIRSSTLGIEADYYPRNQGRYSEASASVSSFDIRGWVEISFASPTPG
ncbi:unnamed protein product, partial [Ectocarpus sp. 8 AP-2014]